MISSKNTIFLNLRKSGNEKYQSFEIKNNSNELKKIKYREKDYKDPEYTKTLYFNEEGSALIYYPKNGEMREVKENFNRTLFKSEEKSLITSVTKLNDDYLLSSKNGITVIPSDSIVEQPKTFFHEINCNFIFIDQEDNIWIGTTGSGVLFIPSLEMDLYNSKNSSLPNDQIFSIVKNEKKEEVIVGQGNGKVSVIKNNKVYSFDLKTSGRVKEIYQSKDREQDYFFGTDSKSFYTQRNDQYYDPLFFTKVATFGTIKKVFQDEERNTFFGKSNYLTRTENGISIDSIFESYKTIFKKRTYAIEQDFLKNIWVGTTEGIYVYKDSVPQPLNLDNQLLLNVSSFVQTNDSIMWVATLGDGVLGFKNFQEVYSFDKANGMASNTCKKVYAKGNQLMVATNQGVNIIDYKNNKIQLINKLDGLPTNDINDVNFGEDEIWVGTSKGLLNFPSNLNHINLTPPRIHVTAFKIWDIDTTLEKSFELKYDQNNFQIEFVGLSFRARGNIKYQYKLTGADANWVTTEARSVRYPSVNPGDYTFEVYAINEDGIKSDSPATFSFQISPPYWQTWWFRILSLLILASLIGLFFYWRFKRIREKESFENSYIQKVNELEQKSLQLQMNPHFIYNTLNAIQYFLTINDAKFAMLYLSRFAKMIRTIFEQSKKKVISLEEEIGFLKLYLNLEQLRFDNKIDVDMQINANLEGELFDIKIPPLLLQPLIENAFKHGLFQKEGKGNIKINFELKGQLLLCTIEDDGVGRKKAAKKDDWKPKNYVSSGIENTRERLTILNDLNKNIKEKSNIEIIDLHDDFNHPIGTRVVVKIRYEQQ
ncbi:MAG: histidine kinase [Saprospiraceae bacterium]